MEIATGSAVYGSRGQQVGEVSRVVLDGRTKRVTHLVVSKGWLLPRDIVVPLDVVASTSTEEVRLRIDEDKLEQQPDFIEEHYVPPDPDEPLPAGYSMGSALYSPVAPAMGTGWFLPNAYGYAGYGYAGVSPAVEIEKNVPDGSVTLTEGMDVWAGDEKAGAVAGVRLHPRTEQVSHIVISKGWLFPEERLVPRSAVARVDELGVHLKAPATETRTVEQPDDGRAS